MNKKELERELKEIVEEGHDYKSCDNEDIDLNYSLGRGCRFCALAILTRIL